MLPEAQSSSEQELNVVSTVSLLERWDLADDSEDRESDGGVDEWAGQKDAELIEELEQQAIMDAYRYGSTLTMSHDVNNDTHLYIDPFALQVPPLKVPNRLI